MKKLYDIFLSVMLIATAGAQTYLTDHFTGGTKSDIASNTVGAVQFGFVTGNDGYSHTVKAQLFDNTYGVSSGGTITGVALDFARAPNSNQVSALVVIWEDDNGSLGQRLGEKNLVGTNIDANTNTNITGNASYDNLVTFDSPIPIPANRKFWAGVVYTFVNMNQLISLHSTADGDFSDASSHTLTGPSEATTFSFAADIDPNAGIGSNQGGYELDIALAVFPEVSFNVGVEDDLENSTLSLGQNFPNPFSGQSRINYTLKDKSEVTFEVFDITGKRVMNVRQGQLPAGEYIIDLNSGDFAPGLYYYTLTVNEDSFSRKMVVVD
ncbi:MAG: T9SS type A sorting domain-containing protein [Bacteroidota bacterium]